jgi:hypothetical protein
MVAKNALKNRNCVSKIVYYTDSINIVLLNVLNLENLPGCIVSLAGVVSLRQLPVLILVYRCRMKIYPL